MKKSRIEQLIAERNTIGDATLKNAINRIAEERAKQQEDALVNAYKSATIALDHAIDSLRAIRKREKLLKERVAAMDAAITEFKEIGDIELLNKKMIAQSVCIIGKMDLSNYRP